MNILVLLLSLAVAAQASRFETIAQDISQFGNDVMSLEKTIQGAIAKSTNVYNQGQDMLTRIDILENRLCGRTEFQCGGKTPKCLSRLLVCDGVEDCANGADESNCKVMTPLGSKWEGDFIYDHCTDKKPEGFTLTVTALKANDALISIPAISAELYVKDELKDFSYATNMFLHGIVDMKPGQQTVYFKHPGSSGLAFSCTFDRVHEDHCHGKIFYVASNKPCAEFFMKKSA